MGQQESLRPNVSPSTGGWRVRPSLQHQQNQQQQQLVQLQDSYMQSRSEALQNVESTIHELGNIFNKLSTLVSQQGEIAIGSTFGLYLLLPTGSIHSMYDAKNSCWLHSSILLVIQIYSFQP